jgi:hypothetical protein
VPASPRHLRRSPRWVGVAFIALAISLAACESDEARNSEQRVHDPVGFLSNEARAKVHDRLELLYRESGIDTHVDFVGNEVGEDLDAYAARTFERLGIAETPGAESGRGLLLVYDVVSERLRVEVGYALEGVLPDAFVGYLVHDNARYLFDSGEPELALRLTIRMLEYRMRMASLGGAFDPTWIREFRLGRYGSGGGGAVARAPAGRGQLAPFVRSMDERWRAEFDAAGTIEESYQRYRDWLGRGVFEPDVELFTEASRRLLRSWPMTPGYFDYVLFQEYGNLVEILEFGSWGLLYSTNNPFVEPLFFRLVEGGWRVDLDTGVSEILSIAGGPYAWSFRGLDGAATRHFAERLTAVDGLLRVRGGDNRPAKVFQEPTSAVGRGV